MRLANDGVKIYFIIIYLLIMGNVFFVGFNTPGSGLSISGLLFYLLIVVVLCLHVIVGRVDFAFVIGCVLTVILKFLSFPDSITDTLMVLVLAWGISYVRYDLSKFHFSIIFIYGCISIFIGALQVLGVEQMHTWNTLMTNSQGVIDSGLSTSLISSPMSLVEQGQIRPPGLFHSNAVFGLFVCYFYAILIQKSLRLLPIGLLAVWVCGSKITLLFSFLFPVLMIFTNDSLPRLFFLKAYATIIVFFLTTSILYPELAMQKYALESMLFSALLRLRNLDQILNLGIDFGAFSVFDGMNDSRERDDTVLSGILGFIPICALILIAGFKSVGPLLTKHSAEFASFLFISLATPITGNPFFVVVLYPILHSLREKRRNLNIY